VRICSTSNSSKTLRPASIQSASIFSFSGSINGFDYNLWTPAADGGFAMSPKEFLATLKYTFDQRNKGNKAPFLLGAHTPFYVDSWSTNAPNASNAKDRQKAIEDFLDYVISKGAKVASHKEILDWMRKPKAE